MAEIVNLRMARKARKREDAVRQAEQNRVRHGQTRSERICQQKQRERLEAKLDGARREED